MAAETTADGQIAIEFGNLLRTGHAAELGGRGINRSRSRTDRVEFSYFFAPIALKQKSFLSQGARNCVGVPSMSDRSISEHVCVSAAEDWPTRDWTSMEWLSVDTAAVVAVASFILLIVVGILPRAPW